MVQSSDNKNIYYNFTYYNDDTVDRPAIISQTRVQNILDDPSNYKLAVIRFNIPAVNIPIQNKFKENYYYVKLVFDGAEVLIYVQQIPNAVVNLGRIWSYQSFIDGINNAFKTAFDQLKILKPLMVQTLPPKIILNNNNDKLEFYFEQSYDSSIPNNIQVIVNNKLYYTFPTLPAFGLASDESFVITVQDQLTNTITLNTIDYYIMYEETSSLFLINDFQNIQFESDTIPISPELIDGSKNITRRVLTDFEGIQQTNNRSSIQYFPQGPLRWIDLKSNHGLRDTDLRILWSTKDGSTHLVYIPPNEALSVKLLFRRYNDDGTFEYT